MKFQTVLFSVLAAIVASSVNLVIDTTNNSQFTAEISIGQPAVANEANKLQNGAVVVLRNQTRNQPLNLRGGANGTKINGSPSNFAVDGDQRLTIRRKPGTDIVQFLANGKIVSIKGAGFNGELLETWNVVGYFDPHQSWYVDTLPNGNLIFSSVKFPEKVINLKNGGTSQTYAPYTLWDKNRIEGDTDRQFKVEVVGKVSIPQDSNNSESIPLYSHVSNSNSNIGLPGGSVGIVSTKPACFILGKMIPVPLVGGFACNQILTRVIYDEWFAFNAGNQLNWGDSQRMCDVFNGKLEWRRDVKVCIKK